MVRNMRDEGDGDIVYRVENILYPLLRQRRAFNIFKGSELPFEPLTLLACDLPQLLARYHLGRVSQIDFRPDDDTRGARAMVVHFWKPLLLDVLERGGRCYAEADYEHVRLRIC
jgi:hypothetical protein